MTIVEIKGGPITYRYLEKKSKAEIIRRYLDHIDAYAKLMDRCEALERGLAHLRRFLKESDAPKWPTAEELIALAKGDR